MNIEKKVDIFRERAIDWFKTMEVKDKGFGVYKCSEFHNVDRFHGNLLAGTYDATNCLVLLGAYNDLNNSQRDEIANFINGFQREDGIYRNPQMKDEDIFKVNDLDYSWEYIDFHITNYSMGALENIKRKPKYNFKFIEKYMNKEALNKWLDKRIIQDPWMEGNNFVNLSSFYVEMMKQGRSEAKELLDIIIKWHDDNQDSNTGYWGTNLKGQPASMLYGMAGAAHDYHIYTYFNKPIDYVEKIVDFCIDFSNEGLVSSCVDVDVVDILANMLPYGYRKQGILDAMERKLIDLLAMQNADGGFYDVKDGIRRQDGWVRGYWEPQGLSNCFATWFRSITIGMAMCCLYPETKDQWKFRDTIGIGYFNKEYKPC